MGESIYFLREIPYNFFDYIDPNQNNIIMKNSFKNS